MRFMMLTFGFMGWAFYELSGGSDFEPETRDVAEVTVQEIEDNSVARADTTDAALTNVTLAASVQSEPVQTKPAESEAKVTLASVTLDIDGNAVSPETVAVLIAPEPAKTVSAVAKPSADGASAQQGEADIRKVTGDRVNMRNGPGTDFSVVTKLKKGMSVEILQEPGNGWVKLRTVETGKVGWMADWLVTASN